MLGVSPNFGALLRDARWTRWNKEQIYTAPQAFRAVGDWGFKQRMTTPYAYGRVEPQRRKQDQHDETAAVGNVEGKPRTAAATADFVVNGASTRYAAPGARMGMLRYVKVRDLGLTFDNKVRWKETERAVNFRNAWFDKGAHTTGFMEAYHKRKHVPSQAAFASKQGDFTRLPGVLGLPPRTAFDDATIKADVYGKLNGTVAAPRAPRSGLKIPGSESAPELQTKPQENVAPSSNATTEGAVLGAWSTNAYILDKRLSVPNYHFLPDKTFAKFLRVMERQRPALAKTLNAKQREAVKVALAKALRHTALEAVKSDPQAVKQLGERSFASWLEEVPSLEQVQWEAPDLWNAARSTDRMEMKEVITKASSRAFFNKADSITLPYQLERKDRVQPSAGLQYAQPDEIFTNALNPAVSGRVLANAQSSGGRGGAMSRLSFRRTSALAVSSGGHMEQVPSAVKDMLLNWNMRRASNPHSEAKFRVMDASMAVHRPSADEISSRRMRLETKMTKNRADRATYMPKRMGMVQATSRPIKKDTKSAASPLGSSFAAAGSVYSHDASGKPVIQSASAKAEARQAEGQPQQTSHRKLDLEAMLKGVNSVLRGRK